MSRDQAGGLLHHFLLSQAAAAPERPAVVELGLDGTERVLTYRELTELADRYARSLTGLCLNVGDRVVLDSPTSAEAIAMVLACSKTGVTFIPVTPEMPAARLRSIMQATEPTLYLRAAADARPDDPGADGPGRVGSGRFGQGRIDVHQPPAARSTARQWVVETDPAYIVFTSGSTGIPKGVVMSHRAIVAFYRGLLAHGIVGPLDRVATTSPFQFDFTLLDIGLALGSGAAVVPVPRAELRWPRRFVKFLSATAATQVNGVPSIWRSTLRYEPGLLADLTRVKGVLFSGEPFAAAELRQLQRALPKAQIFNCFGSTESVACTLSRVPPLAGDNGRLSIGVPHPGSDITLLDEQGWPVLEPGVVGEIYLRSPALFSCYWDNPAATRAALVPDPLDPRTGQLAFKSGDLAYFDACGQLFFVGRSDSLVKVRGNRVELGEVERKLAGFAGVAAAVVIVVGQAGTDPGLLGFVVPEDPLLDIDKVALTAHCARDLPDYMVPNELRVLTELPVNENGKVDRVALAALAALDGRA